MKENLIAIRKKLDTLKHFEDYVNDKVEFLEKIEREFYKTLGSRYMADPLLQRVKLACFIRRIADNVAPGEICTEVKEEWNGRDEKSYPVVTITAVYKPKKESIATWKVDLATKKAPYLVTAAEIVRKIKKGLDKV